MFTKGTRMKKVITAALVGGAIVGSLLGAGTASATTSGTFLVPTEISPGSYRVVSSDGTGTGYWETCATLCLRRIGDY